MTKVESALQCGGLSTLEISDLIWEIRDGFSLQSVADVHLRHLQIEMAGPFECGAASHFTFRDSSLRLKGQMMLVRSGAIQFRDLQMMIQAEQDAVVVHNVYAFGMDRCFVATVTASPDAAAFRLADLEDIVIADSHIRATHPGKAGSTGIESPNKMVATFLSTVSGTMDARKADVLAGQVATMSVEERQTFASELHRAVESNFVVLRADERDALLKMEKTLGARTVPEATIRKMMTEVSASFAADKAAPEAAFIDTVAGQDFGVALVIADGGSVCRITQNIIQGYVALYGDPGPARINQGVAREIDKRMKQGPLPVWLGGALHFSDNEVLSVLLAAPLKDTASDVFKLLMGPGTLPFTAFRTASFANNSILRPTFEVLADSVVFNANTIYGVERTEGVIIAHRVTVTGNLSYALLTVVLAASADAHAANLAITLV